MRKRIKTEQDSETAMTTSEVVFNFCQDCRYKESKKSEIPLERSAEKETVNIEQTVISKLVQKVER